MIRRRDLIIGAGAAVVAAPGIAYAEEPIVIKMGALKLIHSIAPYFYDRFTPSGYQVQVIPFESPADGKNAVVTKSVDFGMFGIAAATLGAAAGEPIVVIASACNKGMAVIAAKNSGINSIKDLRSKRVESGPARPRRCLSSNGCAWKECRSPTSPRCGCFLATCISHSRTGISTLMSAPNQAQA